jgi:hypothetical protein
MFKKILVVVLVLVGLGFSADSQNGWESLDNWRKLERGQSTKVVKSILGEPERVEGGSFTYWRYPGMGTVVFYNGRVDSWDEPRWFSEDSAEDFSDVDVGIFVLVFLGGLLILSLLPLVWVLASGRSSGGAKFGWFLVVLFFSWLGLAAFLIFTQGRKKDVKIT